MRGALLLKLWLLIILRLVNGLMVLLRDLKQDYYPSTKGRLRSEVKESTGAVLSREFKPYELRKFFAT